MSRLPDRREAPRRRIRASGMHPGWACFLVAFSAGIFTTAAMGEWVSWMLGRGDLISTLIVSAIAIVLFAIGGKKAEKLTEQD